MLSLKFNPLIPGNRNLALSSDLDPDSNFNFDMFRCDYFTESQFNELFHKTRSSFSNCFSLLHLNIRSLSRNYDNFTSFLANIEGKFSIMGVSETWLKDSGSSFDIMGYDFIHNPRPNRIGGGVGIYIDNDLEFKLRPDLAFRDISSPSTESLFIEIRRPLSKNIIIGVIYRPPDSNVNDFVQNFNPLLAKIGKENKLSYLLGDFNLNLMNYHSHSLTGEFVDVSYANLFVPLIVRPTRLTSYSASLIDNIFTNSFCNNIVSGLFFTDVSDHLPILRSIMNRA